MQSSRSSSRYMQVWRELSYVENHMKPLQGSIWSCKRVCMRKQATHIKFPELTQPILLDMTTAHVMWSIYASLPQDKQARVEQLCSTYAGFVRYRDIALHHAIVKR